VVEILTIGAIQVRFLSFSNKMFKQLGVGSSSLCESFSASKVRMRFEIFLLVHYIY